MLVNFQILKSKKFQRLQTGISCSIKKQKKKKKKKKGKKFMEGVKKLNFKFVISIF